MLCPFPIEAGTDDHKFNDLNNTNLLCHSSEGQKSHWTKKSRCWQGCVPAGGSRGGPVLCLLQLPEAAPASLASELLSVLKASNHMAPTSASRFTSPSLIGLSCLHLSLRTPLLSHQVHPDNPGYPVHLKIFKLIV